IALAPGVVTAGVAYLLTIVFIGGAFPNKSLTDPIYSPFSMEVVKDRERGTTNGIMHAFSEFPMGVGAWIAGPFMASGNWTMPYCLARAVYTLAFLTFYAYFSRVEPSRAQAVTDDMVGELPPGTTETSISGRSMRANASRAFCGPSFPMAYASVAPKPSRATVSSPCFALK